MSQAFPFPLVIAWVLFVGFLNTHQRHASGFQGASEHVLLALKLSVSLGFVTGLALLLYYALQTSWLYAVVLFVAGGVVAGGLFGVLDHLFGRLTFSLLAFLGWPTAAIWFYSLIRHLHT